MSLSAAAAFAGAVLVVVKLSQPSKLDAIPTVGSSSWLDSWWAGFRYLSNALDVIQEGYEKHKLAPFKVAELYRWKVILSSPEHIEELRSAPDDALSFDEATNELLRTEYTMGPEIYHNPYHIPLIRSKLTRNIASTYPEMKAETIMAFDDVLDLEGSEWKSVPASSTIQKVICRTTNRLLVGLPLCRNHEWIDLTIHNTLGVVKGAAIIGMFPDLLKPIAGRFLTNVNQTNQRARELLRPTIEERRRYLAEYGDEWVDKPNDFLSWLMEEAEGPELSVKSLTARILTVNFAAIHTTSVSFTHVLFYLAANPQYIHPLREEVEGIIENEGWSKAAVGKMRKVDSFLRECQRLEGLGGLSLTRKALKDYTFADGTFVPKGTTISAASRPVHLDEALYKNAHVFKPFRFADLRDERAESLKHHFVSTTVEYLPFGHGQHACPGRFFAATELKTMLAYIVTTYDVRLEDATRPESVHFAASLVPNPTAKVMFRRRVD